MSDTATITEQVRGFVAKNGGAPFTSRQCFDAMDDIEDIQPVYVALNGMFKAGEIVRRKKAAGHGFEYLRAEQAGKHNGFEAHAGHKINGSETKSITVQAEQMPKAACATANAIPTIADTLQSRKETPPAAAEKEKAKPGSANSIQIGGSHYKASIETWDYILAHDLGYLEGNIVKYVTRHRKKNGLEDLRKARHYLDKLIEHETAKEQA